MRTTVLVLIFAAFTLSAAAQVNDQKLDSLFNILAVNDKAMGSVAISKNGKLLYSRATGYSSVDDNAKTAATSKTKYRIGSISKMFTAVMIFQLIEEGKLELTTKLENFFPAIPNAGKITIAALLGHRSGLHNFTDDAAYLQWMTTAKTQEEMVRIISAAQPDFEPGTKASYSNSNYVLLGYIIEKITRTSYSANLATRITSKIGLDHTSVGGKTNPANNESHSYHFTDNWQQDPETDLSIPGGAGAIISTPTDLVKFAEALFSAKLISRKSLSEMSDVKEGYGMGLFKFPFNEKRAYGHTGGIDGFSSMLAYFPSDSLAVAYTTNGQVYPMNDIMIGVLSIYFNHPYQFPSFHTVKLKGEELDQFTGVYSTTEMPLKITIRREGATLTGQATGQSAFPLEAIGKNRFQFLPAGLELEFDPAKKEMILRQGGGSFLFTKEK